MAVQLLPGADDVNGTVVSDHKIDKIEFADGAVWDINTLEDKFLLGTVNDDVLTGRDGDDVMSGQAGSDDCRVGLVTTR